MSEESEKDQFYDGQDEYEKLIALDKYMDNSQFDKKLTNFKQRLSIMQNDLSSLQKNTKTKPQMLLKPLALDKLLI